MMTKRDIVKAMSQKPDMYPYNCPCLACGFEWWQHKGEICPRCDVCGLSTHQHVIGLEPKGVTEPLYVDWLGSDGKTTVVWGWCHVRGVTRFMVHISLLEPNRDVPGFDA